MIKRNLLLILLTGLIGIAVLNASTTDQENNSISDINNGIQVESLKQLSSVRDEQISTDYIVLNLWASWCIPCQNEVHELLKISERSNITDIGILVGDSASNGRECIEDHKRTYKSILEEEESDLILS